MKEQHTLDLVFVQKNSTAKEHTWQVILRWFYHPRCKKEKFASPALYDQRLVYHAL